jgi:hypothetical protein
VLLALEMKEEYLRTIIGNKESTNFNSKTLIDEPQLESGLPIEKTVMGRLRKESLVKG